ncbi:MAG: hypothetical protein AAFU79_15465, partial [Myxococcota bacterium]
SNGLKLTIIQEAGGVVHRLHESEVITRIAEGAAASGQLSAPAVERTLEALSERVQLAEGWGIEAIAGVATAGLRGVGGADRFFRRAAQEAKLRLSVISGDTEAALSFRAATDLRLQPSLRGKNKETLVIDVGGRSTELARGRGSVPGRVQSLALGGITLFERFVRDDPPCSDGLDALDAEVRSFLRREVDPEAFAAERALGLSGTVLALAGEASGVSTLAELRTAQPWVLTPRTVRDIAEKWAGMPSHARTRGELLPAGRSDVVVAGSRWVWGLMTHLQRDLEVSTASLGLGVALTLLDGASPASAS